MLQQHFSQLLALYDPGDQVTVGVHTKALIASLPETLAQTDFDIYAFRQTAADFVLPNCLDYPITISAVDYKHTKIGTLPCEVLKHKNSHDVPTIVVFYGGGFCLDMLEPHKAFFAHVAAQAPCNIVLPHLPLAPEHKASEVMASIGAFLQSLLSHPESIALSHQFIFSGWSSGANIAISAALDLQAYPALYAKLVQIISLSAWVDLSMKVARQGPYLQQQSADSIAAGADVLEKMTACYLPENAKGDEAQYCPAHRDFSVLSSLPPTTLIVGGSEVLLGDSVYMAHALKQAGAPGQLVILEGQTHNYLVLKQLAKDGVFVPDVVARLIGQKPIENMKGHDGLGLVILSCNAPI